MDNMTTTAKQDNRTDNSGGLSVATGVTIPVNTPAVMLAFAYSQLAGGKAPEDVEKMFVVEPGRVYANVSPMFLAEVEKNDVLSKLVMSDGIVRGLIRKSKERARENRNV